MNQLDAIQQIETDFEEGNGPFENVEFPESRLVRELDAEDATMEERARITAFFCTLDYNRNAKQLVDNLIELHESFNHNGWFRPKWLVRSSSEEALQKMMEDIGFRYPNRDSHGWYKNCQIFTEKYNSRITELILSTSCNAPKLIDQLNEDGFLYIKGAKIAPMFARIFNDEVAPLNDMWTLDIPVDTWVRKITKELTDTDMSDDDIRVWWEVIGEQSGISRHIIDGGMWQIGNNWGDWGEEYFSEVTGKDEFEYL